MRKLFLVLATFLVSSTGFAVNTTIINPITGKLDYVGSAAVSGGSGYSVEPATVTFDLQKGFSASTGSITGANGLSVTYGISGGSLTLSGLTASLPVQTNGSKQLTSAAINLSGAQVTGSLPAASIAAGSLGGSVIASNIAAGTYGISVTTALYVTNLVSLSTGVTGIQQAAQEPAHTGDVTNSASSLVLTASSNQPNINTLAASSVTVNGANGLLVKYQVNVGSITGAGLTTCGDSSHALSFNTTTGLYGCQSVTGTAGSTQFGDLAITWDGSGSVLTTGTTYWLHIPSSGTINGVRITANPSGSATVGVSTAAIFALTNLGSVCASACPTLSSSVTNTDTTLTGWNTAVAKDGWIGFVLNTISTVTNLNVVISYQKS